MFYYLNSSSSLRDNHHLIISIFILKTSKLSHFAFFSPSFSLRLYLINYFLSSNHPHTNNPSGQLAQGVASSSIYSFIPTQLYLVA